MLKHTQREILQDLLVSHPARKQCTQDIPQNHAGRLLRRPLCASLKSSRRKRTATAGPPSDSGSGRSSQTQSGSLGQGKGSPNMFLRLYHRMPQLLGARTNGTGSSTSGTQPNNDANARASPGLWLAFGVWGPQITVRLDQIDKHALASDQLFLRELRRRHDKLRGWLRLYFSFQCLKYWEFSKAGLPLSLYVQQDTKL